MGGVVGGSGRAEARILLAIIHNENDEREGERGRIRKEEGQVSGSGGEELYKRSGQYCEI